MVVVVKLFVWHCLSSMSDWPAHLLTWVPAQHEVPLRSVLLPTHITHGTFKQQAKVVNESNINASNYVKKCTQSANNTLLCLHSQVKHKNEPQESSATELLQRISKHLSIWVWHRVGNRKELRVTFGPSMIGIRRLLRAALEPLGETVVHGDGWYSVPYTTAALPTVVDILQRLGAHYIEPLANKLTSASNWQKIYPEIYLHNMMLQQLTVTSSSLGDDRNLYECKQRYHTSGAVLGSSVGATRAEAHADVPDLYSKQLSHFAGNWLSTQDFQEPEILTLEEVVAQIRQGYNLCKRSLPQTVRDVCSSALGNTTLDWVWMQRTSDANLEDDASVPGASSNGSLDLELDEQELEIVNENNPMGLWPVSITRPMTKIRLGRLRGRHNKRKWFQNRWQYVPVVFKPNASNTEYERVALAPVAEPELKQCLLAATTYMHNRALLTNVDSNDTATRDNIDTFQQYLRSIMSNHGFSWQPLWLKRDTISMSIQSDSDRVQASSIWTSTGSMVHEHLFCEAFVEPDKLAQLDALAPDAVPGADLVNEQGCLLGKSKDKLFVPDSFHVNADNPDDADNLMTYEAFCSGRLPPVADSRAWASRRPVGALEALGVQYAQNASASLLVALNSIEMKRRLFQVTLKSKSDAFVQDCKVLVHHVAPEYPVIHPFSVSSAGGSTKPELRQKPMGYETRIDSMVLLQLRSKDDTVLQSCVAIVEYKTRMELSALGSGFSNRQIPQHFADVSTDVKAARNYFEAVASHRSHLQAESNAWMFYLNTGLLPSFCISVSTTRRCTPKIVDPLQVAAHDKKDTCVRTSKDRQNSGYVCGTNTLNLGTEFECRIPNKFASLPNDPDNLVVPIPCAIIGIRNFDVRETNLLDILNRITFCPFRGPYTKDGVSCYADRHVCVPELQATLPENKPAKESPKFALYNLLTTLPTCELSRALVAALQRSHCRFGRLPGPSADNAHPQRKNTLKWVLYLTDPGSCSTARQEAQCTAFRAILSPLENFDPDTLITNMITTLPAEAMSAEALKQYIAPEAPLLYTQYAAAVKMLTLPNHGDTMLVTWKQLPNMQGLSPVVLAHTVSANTFISGLPAQAPQAIQAALSQGLFRRDVVVPIQRHYPSDELSQHKAMRKEWCAWVEHMAQSLLTYLDVNKQGVWLRGNATSESYKRTCMQLAQEADKHHREVQANLLFPQGNAPSNTDATLHMAACAAITCMDAEDFYGLTLIAGNQQSIRQMQNNLPLQEKEHAHLVQALKQALYKLHTNFEAADPREHWHWDMLHTLVPNEDFSNVSITGEKVTGFADMHKFDPIPPNQASAPRPSEQELLQSRTSNSPGLPTPRQAWVKDYHKQLTKHKAHSLVRMIHRVFNSRVLAAVSAMTGESAPLVHRYEGNEFDLASFAHMSQRAYWSPGVMAFCDYKQSGSQSVPYWLGEVFRQCVQELSKALSLAPVHTKLVAKQLGIAPQSNPLVAPSQSYAKEYKDVYQATGVNLLAHHLAQLNVTAPVRSTPEVVAHPVAPRPADPTLYVTQQQEMLLQQLKQKRGDIPDGISMRPRSIPTIAQPWGHQQAAAAAASRFEHVQGARGEEPVDDQTLDMPSRRA